MKLEETHFVSSTPAHAHTMDYYSWISNKILEKILNPPDSVGKCPTINIDIILRFAFNINNSCKSKTENNIFFSAKF